MGKAYFHEYEKLKKYLDSELYCREERQYAVFLYNIFLKKKMKAVLEPTEIKIIKACLNSGDSDNIDIDDIDIENVYFEATLMRDYFEKDKKQFNDELLSFCLEWLPEGKKLKSDLMNEKEICNVNFGQKNVKDYINSKYEKIDIAKDKEKAKEKACLYIARMMMNATPDILVVYTKKEKEGKEEKKGIIYAKALECKYKSDEGRYKDIIGSECKMQLFIQECIMHFCFGSSQNPKGKYIPLFPSKSKWKDKPRLWEDICLNVYKGILEQITDDIDTVGVKNAGVEMVRFCSPVKKTEEVNTIKINENVCIEVCIEPGESYLSSTNDKKKWRYVKSKTKK